MDEWKSYNPTFTKVGSKNIKLPDGRVSNYYWSRFHIVTTEYGYQQQGKKVNFRVRYKRLGLWESLKFLVRTICAKRDVSNG